MADPEITLTEDDLVEIDRLLTEVERRDVNGDAWMGAPIAVPKLPSEPPRRRRRTKLGIWAIVGALAAAGAVWLAVPMRDDLTPRGGQGDAPVSLAAFVHRGDALIDLAVDPPHALRPGDLLSVQVSNRAPERLWAIVWAEDDTGARVELSPRGPAAPAFEVPHGGAWSGPEQPFDVGTLGLAGPGRIVAVFVPVQASSAQLDLFVPEATTRSAIIVHFGGP